MSWFKKLTGFYEDSYEQTQRHLEVRGQELHSLVNGGSWHIGHFETPSLGELRQLAQQGQKGRVRVSNIVADATELHTRPTVAGSLVQVASQFNALEMTGPSVTPNSGVTQYEFDHTQGPACAIAAGAGTIYRNYFIPFADGVGQTEQRQVNNLADLQQALPGGDEIVMKNGYALLNDSGLATINTALNQADPAQIDAWRSLLRIGLHWDVQVTIQDNPQQRVSQAYCSALPISYNRNGRDPRWAPFAALILEASYEATLWAAVLNHLKGNSNQVYLTFIGGGVFGNQRTWILSAIERALHQVQAFDLDVYLVSYGRISADTNELVDRFKQHNQ